MSRILRKLAQAIEEGTLRCIQCGAVLGVDVNGFAKDLGDGPICEFCNPHDGPWIDESIPETL